MNPVVTNRIIFETAKYFGVSPRLMKGKRGKLPITEARQIAQLMLRETGLKIREIASVFDTHVSCPHINIERILGRISTEPELAAKVQKLRLKLFAGLQPTTKLYEEKK